MQLRGFVSRVGCSSPTKHLMAVMRRYGHQWNQRAGAISRALEQRFKAILLTWLVSFALASIPKILVPASPVNNFRDFAPIVLPYLLVALAPALGYRVACGAFPARATYAQPVFRFSLFGRWKRVNVLDASASPAFGPAGLLTSLLIGLLLNVVFRSIEFLVSVPAMNGHAPEWGQLLFHMMAADVIIMSFFYVACFVMALRSVPYFPRMLIIVWGFDIFMQLFIAREVGMVSGLPKEVAAPLKDLLHGNVLKVLISAFVWLPYLILSERVNITYRQRTGSYSPP